MTANFAPIFTYRTYSQKFIKSKRTAARLYKTDRLHPLFKPYGVYSNMPHIIFFPQRTILRASRLMRLGTSGYAVDSTAPAITMPAAMPAINVAVLINTLLSEIVCPERSEVFDVKLCKEAYLASSLRL